MRTIKRRQSPAVKNGQVQFKNNWEQTPNYYTHPQRELVIERKRPGAGYTHVLLQRDILEFISILPDWEELSRGLSAIVLAPGKNESFGTYHCHYGVIHVRAWPEDFQIFYDDSTFGRDEPFLDKLNVPHYYSAENRGWWAEFTPQTARAFSLIPVFIHELGHHHDAMTNKSGLLVRGEPYAEEYERRYGDLIWERFTSRFSID